MVVFMESSSLRLYQDLRLASGCAHFVQYLCKRKRAAAGSCTGRWDASSANFLIAVCSGGVTAGGSAAKFPCQDTGSFSGLGSGTSSCAYQ
jgi:hypothetical protein